MEVPRFWRTTHQRMRLQGEICENGHYVYPPRDICPDCHGDAHIPHTFSGEGTIYSFSENLALIDLKEGPRVTAQLTDPDPERPFEIGMPVEMVTRKYGGDEDERGVIIYGYKFRPSFATEASMSSK